MFSNRKRVNLKIESEGGNTAKISIFAKSCAMAILMADKTEYIQNGLN